MELLVSAHRNVFMHREFGKGLSDLKCADHAAAGDVMHSTAGNVLALEGHPSGIDGLKAGNTGKQRCLTRAVGPDQRHNPALADFQRGVVNCFEPAEDFGQSLDFEHHAPPLIKRLPIRLNKSIRPLGKKAMMITSKVP